MKNNALTFPEQDAIWIMGSLYIKKKDAFDFILEQIKQTGYSVKDCREDEDRLKRVTVEQMEEQRSYLWYCHLEDIRYGKCGSCKQYISTRGIESQNHTCEKCGAVTYQKIKDGSIVRFEFKTDRFVMFGPELKMKAYWWDTEHDDLYLYPEFLEDHSFANMTPEKCRAYLDENQGKWREEKLDGKKYIVVKYQNSFYVEEVSTIDVKDIFDHYWNHKIVKLWGGKEYGEWDHLDIPESFVVYEIWNWKRLEPSPILHKDIFHAVGQVSDQGWYHQDGRNAFDRSILNEMRKFIVDFTTLDVERWDRVSSRFSLSGPGLIRDVARFCSDAPEIENKPNIGNALEMIAKLPFATPGEIDAGLKYFLDDDKTEEEKQFDEDFFGGIIERNRERKKKRWGRKNG